MVNIIFIHEILQKNSEDHRESRHGIRTQDLHISVLRVPSVLTTLPLRVIHWIIMKCIVLYIQGHLFMWDCIWNFVNLEGVLWGDFHNFSREACEILMGTKQGFRRSNEVFWSRNYSHSYKYQSSIKFWLGALFSYRNKCAKCWVRSANYEKVNLF